MSDKEIPSQQIEGHESVPPVNDEIIQLATQTNRKKLHSTLLEVYSDLAEARTPADVFRQYQENRFLNMANISQRELLHLDSLMYEVIEPDFDDVVISPVSPLGVNAVLTKLSQKNVISAARNVEVVAAITPSLALECARRRKASALEDEVHLCTSHRNIRAQTFDDLTKFGFTPHFQLFAMGSAAHAKDNVEFSGRSLEMHLRTILNFLRRANASGQFAAGNVSVSISSILGTESLITRKGLQREHVKKKTTDESASIFRMTGVDLPDYVSSMGEISIERASAEGLTVPMDQLRQIDASVMPSLKMAYPEVDFNFHLSRLAGIGYYNGICYKIHATNARGESFPLLDGGSADWVSKFVSDKREKFFGSGFGSELFGRFFKTDIISA